MYINLGLVCFGALRGRGGTVAMAGPGANFYGMRLANGLFHVLNMFRDAATGDEAYNPGVLTGVVLIIPSGYLALRALRQDGILTSWGAARAMALGVFAHIPLLIGLYLRSREKIGDLVFVVWQFADLIGLLSIARPR